MTTEIPCQDEVNRDLFEWIIEQTVYPAKDDAESSAKVRSKRRANERFAKRICLGDKATGMPACPVLTECLRTFGRDYALGVVAGMTDEERRKRFEKATA